MNIFQRKIQEIIKSKETTEEKIIKFSKKLIKLTNLSEEELLIACRNNISWTTKSFNIYAQYRSFKGWITLLEVTPKYCNNKEYYNYNLEKDFIFPPEWIFLPQGTKTKVLPNKEIQKQVIQEIKELLKEPELKQK